tara:strand:- start:50 stop:187 length:138 start_codon:yes stop_codon:yes gene_type:complete
MGRCLEVIVVIARDKKEAALEFLVPFFFVVDDCSTLISSWVGREM